MINNIKKWTIILKINLVIQTAITVYLSGNYFIISFSFFTALIATLIIISMCSYIFISCIAKEAKNNTYNEVSLTFILNRKIENIIQIIVARYIWYINYSGNNIAYLSRALSIMAFVYVGILFRIFKLDSLLTSNK